MSAENGDPLAQSVEHHTFNVGVLGSNPKRITNEKSSYDKVTAFLVIGKAYKKGSLTRVYCLESMPLLHPSFYLRRKSVTGSL